MRRRTVGGCVAGVCRDGEKRMIEWSECRGCICVEMYIFRYETHMVVDVRYLTKFNKSKWHNAVPAATEHSYFPKRRVMSVTALHLQGKRARPKDEAKPSQAKPSQAKPSQAKPSITQTYALTSPSARA